MIFFDSYRTVPLSFRVSLVERDFRGGLKMMNSVLATFRESLFAQSQVKRDLRSAWWRFEISVVVFRPSLVYGSVFSLHAGARESERL